MLGVGHVTGGSRVPAAAAPAVSPGNSSAPSRRERRATSRCQAGRALLLSPGPRAGVGVQDASSSSACADASESAVHPTASRPAERLSAAPVYCHCCSVVDRPFPPTAKPHWIRPKTELAIINSHAFPHRSPQEATNNSAPLLLTLGNGCSRN